MNTTHHLGSEFYLTFLRFLLGAKQQLVEISARYGLTGIQAATLLLLDDARHCPMKQIGHMFHCDASNVTGIIDGLESKGLVLRENDPADRRIKTIRICPKGLQLQAHIMEELAEHTNALFAPLTTDETRQFAQLVCKLHVR